MIVDDERLVRWSLRQKCEEWGYLVIEADSGEAAIRLDPWIRVRSLRNRISMGW